MSSLSSSMKRYSISCQLCEFKLSTIPIIRHSHRHRTLEVHECMCLAASASSSIPLSCNWKFFNRHIWQTGKCIHYKNFSLVLLNKCGLDQKRNFWLQIHFYADSETFRLLGMAWTFPSPSEQCYCDRQNGYYF